MLLDTHVVLWLANGDPLLGSAIEISNVAKGLGGLLISPVTFWEIGTLVRKGRLHLTMPPDAWLQHVLAGKGVRIASLSPTAAVASSHLPEPFHSDPADRLLVATARELGVPLMTRDAKILEYAAAGHVQAVPC